MIFYDKCEYKEKEGEKWGKGKFFNVLRPMWKRVVREKIFFLELPLNF